LPLAAQTSENWEFSMTLMKVEEVKKPGGLKKGGLKMKSKFDN
jgi:hypothetical protein